MGLDGGEQRATALAAEIIAETQGRERFSDFAPSDFAMAAQTIVRYRTSSVEGLRRTCREARSEFIKVLREALRLRFPEMRYLPIC